MSSYIHSSSSSGLSEHLCNLCKWEEIQEEMGRETILTHTLLFDTRTRKRRYTSGSPTFSLPRYVLKNNVRVTSCILVSVWRRSEQVHRDTGQSGDVNPDGKIMVFKTQNIFFLSVTFGIVKYSQGQDSDFLQCHHYFSTIMLPRGPMAPPSLEIF